MMKSDKKNINALAVMLENTHVGMINRLAGDQYIFSFEQKYIDNPERPTLSLSFKEQTGGLITSTRLFNSSLPPFFSNLLPEGHLRTYLAHKAGIKPQREFFLLAALGMDLPGALTVLPLEAEKQIDKPYKLVDEKNNQYKNIMRFSLAGIQLKFSAIMESSGGLTIPADGQGGSWIIKLPSARFSAVPENEFVMLALAKAIGISLPENRLLDMHDIHGLPEDGIRMQGKALAIKRFDRSEDGRRIHMEDFAQIFGLYPHAKYDKKSYANIASVLSAEMGNEAVFDFMRRLVFSVMIGNADMHLKNWSILYPDKRTPVLSPAYDFVATLPYIANDQLALSFGDSRSLNDINPEQIRRFADVARLSVNPLSQIVVETIERTIAAWRNLPEKELLPREIFKVIDKQIEDVAGQTIKLFLNSKS